MKYLGIIFDLDGVICSTDNYHYQAWKALADRLDISFDPTVNQRLRGVSRMESLSILLEKAEKNYSEEEKIAFAEEKNRCYKNLLTQMTPADLDKEVKETLDGLRSQGYQLAIGSSSKNARFILERLGLNHYFDAIADGTDITKSKPDPEVFLKAASYLKLPPEKCLVVEDAAAGIEAADAGGMDSVLLGKNTYHSKAVYQIDHFQELTSILR